MVQREIDIALTKGVAALCRLQDPRGPWIGEVGRTTLPLLLYLLAQTHFKRANREPVRLAIEWLLANQNDDGGWGQWLGDASSIEYTRIARRLLRRLGGFDSEATSADRFVDAAQSGRTGGDLAGLENLLARTILAETGELQWQSVSLPPLPVAVLGVERGMLPGPMPYAGLAASLLKWRSVRPLPWDRLFVRRAVNWLLRHQGDDGSWQGSVHTTAMVAVALEREPTAAEAIARALDYCDAVQLADGGFGMVKTLTTWETVLSILALVSVDKLSQQDATSRAARWLEQIQLPDGAWAWDFHPGSNLYGDIDDSIYGALAVQKVLPGSDAPGRAIAWVKRLQAKDGGWATFGKVMRRPDMAWAVPDITGHAVHALADLEGRNAPAALAGARWLMDNQSTAGSWRGYWGIRQVYGTSTALEALAAVTEMGQGTAIERGAAWLESSQREDGGWGEGWSGEPANSTSEQTAWALLGLAAAARPYSASTVQRGLSRLLATQQPDGGWPRGMTGSFTHRYMGSYGTTVLGIVFPILALSEWRKRIPQ